MFVRLALLYVGLAVFGFGIALLVTADLGVPPWDVFHTGLADLLGWQLGATIVAVSFVVPRSCRATHGCSVCATASC